MRDRNYYVYIVASRSRTLYIGVTSNLARRIEEHRTGVYEGFTAIYRCHRLVWLEHYVTVARAIDREKQLKGWSRSKKIRLMEQDNPTWVDLSGDWGKEAGPSTASGRRSDADFARDDKHI